MIRAIALNTQVKLNGANLGASNAMHIDPSGYGIAYVVGF